MLPDLLECLLHVVHEKSLPAGLACGGGGGGGGSGACHKTPLP